MKKSIFFIFSFSYYAICFSNNTSVVSNTKTSEVIFEYYMDAEFREVIKLGLDAENNSEELNYFESPLVLRFLYDSFARTQNFNEALKYANKVMELVEIYPYLSTIKKKVLNDISLYCFCTEDFQSAVYYAEKALKADVDLIVQPVNEITSFSLLSLYYILDGQKEMAIEVLNKLTLLMSHADSYGGEYRELASMKKMYELIIESINQLKDSELKVKEITILYRDILHRLEDIAIETNEPLWEDIAYKTFVVNTYCRNINDNEYLDELKKYINICKKNSDYPVALFHLKEVYNELTLKDNDDGLDLKVIINDLEKEIIDFSLGYAYNSSNIAKRWAESENFYLSINFSEKAIEIFSNYLSPSDPQLLEEKTYLAYYYSRTSDYADALSLCNEVISSIPLINKEISWHGLAYHTLSIANFGIGYFKEALNAAKHAYIIYNSISDKNLSLYDELLEELSYLYVRNKEFDKGVELAMEVVTKQKYMFDKNLEKKDDILKLEELKSRILDLEHLEREFNKMVNNNDNIYKGEMIEGIRDVFLLRLEYYILIKKIFDNSHIKYMSSLSNLSQVYAACENYKKAIEIEEELLEVISKYKFPVWEKNINSLTNISSYFREMGVINEVTKYNESIINFIESKYKLDIWLNYFPNTISCFKEMAINYLYLSDSIGCKNILNILTSHYFTYVTHQFSILTKEERAFFWINNKIWFETWIPNFIFKFPQKDIMIQTFNHILLSKGILLNSEMEFNKFLAETGDEELLVKYNEIKSLRLQLNKLYEKPIAERYVDTDSLERRANELERQLMQESAEFGDYTRNLSITWKDVRDNLKEKDAAIEFVHFTLNNDSTMYMAYVLRPGMEAPGLVKLFEEKDLTSLSDNEIYKSIKGSEMIWAKLQPQLECVENVYFAPDGELHQIGIEYLPDYEIPNNLISDRYNLYRLSSTRQIAITQPAKLSDDRAIIYGGIQYDTDPDTMKIESAKYLPTKRSYTLWYNTADSISVRSRQGYLKHTLTEAQSLRTLFNDNNKPSTIFTGNEASEESFKSLSGKNSQIIHIATHGFYWDEDDAEYEASKNERLLFMSQFGENARRNVEDKALNRTGLFMAGANNTLMGDVLPEGVDDGILTAQEIANLDLRGLDLVVLSACQTGMGDISGDGVFGLQRGFKKAGANTILMSLWDVNDEATQILMTNFYKNYLDGMSKQQALREAQKTVRKTPGFSDPEYWAAFILLDALN